jgi:hypothetical protein
MIIHAAVLLHAHRQGMKSRYRTIMALRCAAMRHKGRQCSMAASCQAVFSLLSSTDAPRRVAAARALAWHEEPPPHSDGAQACRLAARWQKSGRPALLVAVR